ncbi:MAG: YitT family protein [Lachnospiraceae bacterium]|jgi:uncharacterized membrane-anchored protein YitT (DUF2179 family)|nr:YitT family protein [Lachnospiraceae bacterium]
MYKITKARYMLNTIKFTSDVVLVTIGSLLLALGICLFLLPNQLSSGGFSGVATVLYYLFNIPMGLTTIVLNIPLFIILFFQKGRGYLVRAIIGTSLLSVFLNEFTHLEALTDDKLLACIYGGILTGLGTAIIFKGHASTGGSELLATIIRHISPKYKTGNLIMTVDTIIVTLNVIVFRNLEVGLYSAIVIYLLGKILDIFSEGIYFSKVIYIISNKFDEISTKINKEVGRGTTGLYGKGMYTGVDKGVLLCVVTRNEVMNVRTIAQKIDPKAFIIISNAREVIGKGFEKVK